MATVTTARCPNCEADYTNLRVRVSTSYPVTCETGQGFSYDRSKGMCDCESLDKGSLAFCEKCGYEDDWSVFLVEKEDGLDRRFHNFYRCDCGESWNDYWACTCNDDCTNCGKEVEPYDSFDCIGWINAEKRVSEASTQEVAAIWDSLRNEPWGKDDPSAYEGVSMDDWAELVKNELEKRNARLS